MDFHQNLEYDFSSKSEVMDDHQNIRSMIFIQILGMDDHQNLGYDFSSKSRLWIIIMDIEYDFSSKY